MTDRTDHRAEAEGLLDYAYETTEQAGELPALVYAAVHALLAIHDTLTATDRYAANEAKQREVEPETPEAAEWLSLDEDDPLDEDDHRDRMDRDGDIWVREPGGCWHVPFLPGDCCALYCEWTLAYANERYGPLAFAPEPPPDGARDDLTASEGENRSEEGGEDDDAQNATLCPEPLWCPECGHHIDDHHDGSCLTLCECIALPSQIAQALIADAVKAERGGRRG